MHRICFLKELLSSKHNPDIIGQEYSLFRDHQSNNFQVHIHESCTSSLDKAWELANYSRMNPGDSVLCLKQTSGRGRMRRQWISSEGNIHTAWMIPCPETEEAGNLLPLILGLSLKRALNDMGITLKLKWPNDLIYADRKVGGILVEERNSQVIAGIGLNTESCPPDGLLREHSPTKPGHLGECLAGFKPEELWAHLVCRAWFWYEDTLCNFSLIDFLRDINSNLWLIGEEVMVESRGRPVRGVLLGIGENGELLVDGCDGFVGLTQGSILKHDLS